MDTGVSPNGPACVMRGHQRFDLAPQRLVGAAGLVQEGVAVASGSRASAAWKISVICRQRSGVMRHRGAE